MEQETTVAGDRVDIRFNVIAAFDENRGIGMSGELPWPHCREDMKRFSSVTTSSISAEKDVERPNVVIMGRGTWESLPAKYRPLKNRMNIVISTTLTQQNLSGYQDTYAATSFEHALYLVKHGPLCYMYKDIFVIGGERLFNEAVADPRCDKIYTTELIGKWPADRHFPALPKYFGQITRETSLVHVGEDEMPAIFTTYESKIDFESPERVYLDVLADIVENGHTIPSELERTGTGTLSTFSQHMKFPIEVVNPEVLDQFGEARMLKYRVPIMTTKTLFHRGVFEELKFFLLGDTDVKPLQDAGVRIWDGNTSREWHDKHGHPGYAVGETGPFYGFQWNHFGGDYPPSASSGGTGVNQLEYCIDLLKRDPFSRRIILSAWNPVALPDMCLPPCHVLYNFKVSVDADGRRRLNCAMHQRSGDMFLGVPFNIYSTALLTIFMSRAANMLPGEISLTIADAHIYSNHMEQVKLQLSRTPYKWPLLQLDADISTLDDMRSLSYADDYKLTEYYKHPAIKASMAV